jgi:hypothetical protein
MRAALLLLVGCADVAEPYELEHARIMAIGVTPPGLAASETARIDVLVTDEAGPRIADPSEVEITSPFGIALERTDAWRVTADDRESIVAFDVTVAVGAETLTAQKTLMFGAHADNPPVPAIVGALDAIPSDDEVVLMPETIDEMWSYRWFSSVGELTGYTRAEVTLEPIAGASGAIALVVRDQAGGTSWLISPAMVQP